MRQENGTQWADISEWLAWWLAEPRLPPDVQKAFDRYYKTYRQRFSPYLRRHYASQTAEVQALMRPGTRVLEVGCGCGSESLWFAMNGASVVGIDVNPRRLPVARERARLVREELGVEIDARFIHQSLFDFEDAAGFDVIWMEQAFHHIEPRSDVPSTLSRLLRPNGHVVISEANGWNPVLQLALLRQRGFQTVRESIDSEGRKSLYGVERVTTAGRISKQFSSQGFEETSRRYFRVLPSAPLFERLAWVEDIVPARFAPIYSHYNIVLRKH